MVKHQPLQVYEKQVLLSLVTGIYGCRWKRYQRSQDESSKWECAWFTILSSSFLLLLFWTYFWLVAQNDFNDFNWLVYNHSGEWRDETIPIVTSTTVGFIYITFLLILALFHISLGQQLNLYWVHKIGVLATLLTIVSGFVSVDDVWGDEWEIILVSLQFTAPFLHIGGLVTLTAVSWLIAGYVVRKERSNFQVTVLAIYILALLALCLAPLTFTCPCIMDRHVLKPPPVIIGRRGAPMLAPENTMMSFSRALQHGASSLEADVTISVDGVPFLMRDHTLRRTTDVSKVFPSREHEDASFFNWTEIHSLNAGHWFLESDPYWTVKTLSPKDRSRIGNLTICSLVEMLRLAARANSSVLLNIRKPAPEHPRFRSWFMDTLWTLQKAGISHRKVTWAPDTDRGRVRGLLQTTNEKLSVEEIRHRGITSLTIHYRKISHHDIQVYLAHNVSVTVYPVNEPWLYSVLWCSGVPSVSSDAPQVLQKVPYPVWLMSHSAYNFIWISSDLVSVAVIMGIFFFQNYHMIRWRISGMQNYNPEQIMLSAVVRRPSRDVNIMKEKLIFSELNNGLGSTEELSLYPENSHVGYSHGGLSC
ncbi:PREDICTED: glycerophosphodiester phosphodiesterase domain-containing protein 5-like isoform X1 [Poecilia mexicana]|uniref:glycerophosphodiester phosphodiesterase domain-containing protein 5-like isoform X1 n=1 Tax=Poecilia mexicana TaxID=48701 RepID=UPI00072E47A0|nr:PREDICTED: glycerophosphodiester phosphodiesterase domain-containing protein 5-like isoform X1 [Poecilia mexicana]XP_014833018.1 PREDICTED: glycerophosphodiester phosphodiesterase domain-containing protein 5-like isoform X1 [Poecilia mexicana]XP_014833019.1 PREDICTED: glycerophosphodiester phosphodiesterase domain-containing protein 5-like isoform X1 [Poecilia mexicana]